MAGIAMVGGCSVMADARGETAPPAVGTLLPHHAVYRLSLASTRDGSAIAGVVGGMDFQWNDVCQGWTTEQKFRVRFLYTQGEDQEMSTSYTTWEAKDGHSYRFNVHKVAAGQPDEDLRGEAVQDAKGGIVHFQKPQHADIPLEAGTMFPTAHTRMLIENALRGGGDLQVRPVFDGSEVEGANAVSAIIGKPKSLAADAISVDALRRPQGWPVHLAFFSRDAQQATPDYDTRMTLLDNGVIQSMLIDYGDFTVRADLVSLQALPHPGC